MQTANKQSRTIFYIVGIIFTTLVLGVGIFFIAQSMKDAPPEPQTPFTNIEGVEEYDGSTVIDSPQIMPDFTLTNQHNEATSLSDLRGKLTLMSFGFTHCPDVCPLTLGEFRAIQTQLGDLAENVNFVFVSVDGSRDTPDVLERYLETQRVPDFIALTGEEAYIQDLGSEYGLYFQANKTDSNGNYSVDHTAGSFLFDEQGRWVMRYAYGIDRTIIISDIEAFLAD